MMTTYIKWNLRIFLVESHTVKGKIYPEKIRPMDRICLLTESSSNSENVILVSVFDMQQVSCSEERTHASGEF